LDSIHLEELNDLWSTIESKSLQDILEIDYNSLQESHIITDVPNFRQIDWTNILGAMNSCAVMTAGSSLGYYDHEGFWSICPFSWYSGGNSEGGFNYFNGVNYSVNIPGVGLRNVSFGPETMLYELAVDLEYDFVDGGVVSNCVFNNLASRFNNYTDDRLGLSFGYDQDCLLGGAWYSTIKNQIDDNRPLALVVDHFSWSSSSGPYNLIGGHAVTIVGYDENHWVGGDPIGVYVNGTLSYDIVWWDYDQIKSDNSEWTLEIESGGSLGSWINAPIPYSPLGDVFTGAISFSWQDVGASQYRVQISSEIDFSSYLYDFTTINTQATVSINLNGTYYWRIAPKNSTGNWCHFGNSQQFVVNDYPHIALNPTTLSFNAIQNGSLPSDKTFSITNSGGGTLNWSVSENIDWLSVESPLTGNSNSATKIVNITTTDLAPDTYTGTITVSSTNADNSPRTLSVSYTVTEIPASPHIALDPSTLSFTSIENGSLPSSKTFVITNSGGGTLNWSVSENIDWLSVESPLTGNSNSATRTVNITTTGLDPDTYIGTVTVSSTNADNSPRTLSVSYTVTETAVSPHIVLNPTTLSFNTIQNGSLPSNETFTITNNGGGTLNWSISENMDWLSIESPLTGNSNSATKTVNITTTDLNPDTYTGTITVNSTNADNSSQTVSVTYIVEIPEDIEIIGYVMDSNNSGINNVTLTFSNESGTASTSSGGFYSHSVSYGWSGTVTPSLEDWAFDPPSRSYSIITSNQSNQNYIRIANVVFDDWEVIYQMPRGNSLNDVIALDEDHAVTIGENGEVLSTSNGGNDWISQNSNTSNSLISVHGYENNVWVVGDYGTIIHSTDFGNTWIEQVSNTTHSLKGVFFVDPSTGWAVGSSGIILHTSDSGNNWILQQSNHNNILKSVAFYNENIGWCVGDNGLILL